MHTVYLTGGTGKLGRAIIRNSYNTRFTIPTRSKAIQSDSITSNNIRFHECDITNKSDIHITNESTVIHCAGIVSFNTKHTKELFHVNVTGTENVVRKAEQAKVKKFVYVSSAITRGLTTGNDHLTETNVSHDDNPYVSTKLSAEKIVIDSDIPHKIIVYPTSCNIHEMIARQKQCKHIPGFPGIINIADIDDVATAIAYLAQTPLHFNSVARFILGGRNLRHIDFVHLVRSVCGFKQSIYEFPKPALTVCQALLYMGNDPINTPYILDSLFKNKMYSSEKAHTLLGLPFRQSSEIIRRAYANA
jgi:nucleoside-diphosphate-sugar epimerase